MIRQNLKRLVVVLVMSLVPMVALAQDAKTPNPKLKNLKGRSFRPSDYHGKVVLVNFWATWCLPCRAEIPELVKLQREYGGRGLQVIGVTYPPQRLASVRRFVRQAKVNYPVALGTKQTKLRFTTNETLPLTVVIGKDGRVRDIIEGILLPEEFEQKIKPLIEEGSPARR